MEKTIYERIEEAVKNAKIEGISYEKGYPRDFVRVDDNLIENEESDTLTPLVTALKVITDTIEKYGTADDDIEVNLSHIPFDEYWAISIGDGR